MKLGTETGSLVNCLYNSATKIPPKVGMGATVLGWTDRHAGTITQVTEDGLFTVQEDKATRTDQNGMSEAQTYEYEPDPNGRLYHFSPVRRGNSKGQIRENGRKDGSGVLIGERRKYHDFSF